MTSRIAAAEELFPELRGLGRDDYRDIGTKTPALMIAMTARTGSSHLCSGLASVLRAGSPTEIFNARDTMIWETKRRGTRTFADFLSSYVAESGDLVVFKTNWIDFEYFKDFIFDIFQDLKIVYLDRFDMEAQAVSLFKAKVSGTWHHSHTIKKGDEISSDDLMKRFDLYEICRAIEGLKKEKWEWERFFFEHEIQPARIFYESFSSSLSTAIRQIVKHLGLGQIDESKLSSDFEQMTDAVNDEWISKVRNYRNGNFYQRYRAGLLAQPSEAAPAAAQSPEPETPLPGNG